MCTCTLKVKYQRVSHYLHVANFVLDVPRSALARFSATALLLPGYSAPAAPKNRTNLFDR